MVAEPKRVRGPRPLKRRIHLVVDGETQEWSYQLASRGVLVRTPDMRATHTVAYGDLLGVRWDEDERRVGLAPSLIKAYVQKVYVDKLPWSYAEHVGAIYFGGGILVYKDALTAKAENDEARRQYQLPLRTVLAGVGKHRWLTLREMGSFLFAATKGRHRLWLGTPDDIRAVVDPLVTLYVDGIVEADRSISDPEVRFRLRWEHRDTVQTPPSPE